jgi:hypothetical protein
VADRGAGDEIAPRRSALAAGREQPLELADGLGLIAAVDPLPELFGVEAAFGVVAAKALAGRFAMGIGGA